MSDTQAKATPSKAARELADRILEAAKPKVTGDFKQDCEAWPDQGLDVSDMAAMIQSHVSDLLEKAEAFRAQNYNRIGVREFVKALEPWKPGE